MDAMAAPRECPVDTSVYDGCCFSWAATVEITTCATLLYAVRKPWCAVAPFACALETPGEENGTNRISTSGDLFLREMLLNVIKC